MCHLKISFGVKRILELISQNHWCYLGGNEDGMSGTILLEIYWGQPLRVVHGVFFPGQYYLLQCCQTEDATVYGLWMMAAPIQQGSVTSFLNGGGGK